MNYVIGGDLGTSAIKLILVDQNGKTIKSVEESYPLSFPQPGFSEQNPMDWKIALVKGLAELSKDLDGEIVGIALDGQMHGLVALDENKEVIRPCILWNDSRSSKECEMLNEVYTKERLLRETGNIAYPGFTLPKILWMKNHELENFKKIKHVLLPKDYLNFILTGKLYTDYSDAAGTLMLDVKNRKWSNAMLSLSNLEESVMPEIVEAGSDLGVICPDIASICNISSKCHIYQGAADNAAGAIGNGVIEDNECNISLGTSGTIFIATDKFVYPENGAIHSFSSATGSNCLLACMLSAASSLKWFNDSILKESDYNADQKLIKEDMLGNNDVFFLPYLMGERSPINDANSRGVFFGLSLDTKREDMTQAILEGVAFALRDSFEAIKNMGVEIKGSYITGGGAKSPLWREILASVLNIPLYGIADSYGSSYGMALLCLVGQGYYASLKEAKDQLIKVTSVTKPNEKLVPLYEKKYQKFATLYPGMKNLF
ncbi:MAG: xylulokinase [Bacilli bacterium]|jgi:xylulokinase|nr:xylulokinase [Bacilli bacterium]